LRDRAGLAKMLDAKRAGAVAVDGAQPAERRRMAVDDGDDAAMRGYVREQAFDMARGVDKSALASALRRRPAGVDPVRRGDRKQANIAPVLGHHADGLDSFG